ncbi:MAG: YfhO family protein [candidate division WOR-3 bacterium]
MKNSIRKDTVYIVVLAILPLIIFGKVLFTGKMLFGTDWVMGEYIQRYFVQENIMSGNFPLWNPMKFTGIPTGEGFLGDIFYPITLFLKMFIPMFILWTLTFVIHSFIAGFGTYMFLKELTDNKDISFFGSIAYMFTGIILTETYGGHDGRVIVMSYLPLVLYFVYMGFQKEKLFYYGFGGIASGFMFLSGHIQSSYYVLLTSLFFVSFLHIDRDFKNKYRNWTYLVSFILGVIFSFVNKNLGFLIFLLITVFLPMILDKYFNKKSLMVYSSLIFFTFITFLVSSVQYVPILRFLPEAARGISRDYNYSISWSMGFPDIIDMFFHGFAGVNVGQINTYWGENPFKLHHSYPGILIMFFGLAGILRSKKDRVQSFFTIVFFITLLIALGGKTPFFRFFWIMFPYFDKFRAPELIIFINIFSLVTLSSLMLKDIDLKSLRISLILITLLGLSIILFPVIYENLFSKNILQTFPENIKQMRINNLRYCLNNLKLIIVFNIIIIVSVFFVISKFKNINRFYLLLSMSLFQFFEMYYYSKDYVVSVPSPGEYYKKDEIVSQIQKDMDLFRVFPISYGENDFLNLYGIQTISGIHPSPFYEYQIFINNSGSVMFNPQTLFDKKNRLRLLNVKYLITPKIPEDTTGYPLSTQNMIIFYQNLFRNMGFQPFFYGNDYMLHISTDFVPRFFVVDSFIKVDNINEALNIIDREYFNPRKYAIVENSEVDLQKMDSVLEYRIDSIIYTPNKVSLTVQTNKESILVMLDQYYKGWKVNVNANCSQLLKVDGIFRGVKIEKGKNKIVFSFSPNLQIVSLLISILGIIIAFLVFFFEKRIMLNRR